MSRLEGPSWLGVALLRATVFLFPLTAEGLRDLIRAVARVSAITFHSTYSQRNWLEGGARVGIKANHQRPSLAVAASARRRARVDSRPGQISNHFVSMVVAERHVVPVNRVEFRR